MKQVFYYLLLFPLLWSCQSTEQVAEEEEIKVPSYTIEQFMSNTAVGGASFSPDGNTLLLHSNASGIYNAYTVPVTGGEMTPLTHSDSSSVFVIDYLPNGEGMLLSMDDNGNEIGHIYLRDTAGNMRDLTPDPTARANFSGWTGDKSGFYFTSNQRGPKYTDLYLMDLDTWAPRMIYKNDDAYSIGNVSHNGRYISLVKSITRSNSDLFLFDRQTGAMTKINEEEGETRPLDFSVDNRYLYYQSNAGRQFSKLIRYDIENATSEDIKAKDWDLSYAYLSENGKYMVTGFNEDGRTVVEITDTETGAEVALPDFEESSITGVNISDDEDKIALYVGGSDAPTDIYVYNISTKEKHRITDNLNPEINREDLVKTEVVRFKSFDGVEIPAIYWRPKQATASHPVPALVWVHGGPGGQTRQSYRPLAQFLANHGYAILGVNNRGSSGYGKDFYDMDNQNHGEDDLRDCIAGRDWLKTQSYIDSSAVGIIGGSYGGFMVMRAMTHTPKAFDVGVNLYGVTNWIRTLRSIPPWWESFKVALYDEMGDPNTADSVRLYGISPVFQGEKVRNPVMVLQGSQDPRVLQVESDEMVEAIRNQGVPVEYVLFEDEGHGFIKKENQQEAYTQILSFLDKYLKNKKE